MVFLSFPPKTHTIHAIRVPFFHSLVHFVPLVPSSSFQWSKVPDRSNSLVRTQQWMKRFLMRTSLKNSKIECQNVRKTFQTWPGPLPCFTCALSPSGISHISTGLLNQKTLHHIAQLTFVSNIRCRILDQYCCGHTCCFKQIQDDSPYIFTSWYFW